MQRDIQAAGYIDQGKQLMRAEQYTEAARLFEQASQRPFHQQSTLAIYLAGLASYYAGDLDVATQRFQTIIQEFPRSRYVPDARYHDALINLQFNTRTKRANGLNELLLLARTAQNPRLAEDALNQARQYLFFDARDAWVEDLYQSVTDEDKAIVLEALCYRKINNGAAAEAESFYREFVENGGASTSWLDSLFAASQPVVNRIETNIIKIALFLPLHLDDYRTRYASELPGHTKPWLEFYEGFALAVQRYQQQSNKKIFLKVYDTRRDTAAVRAMLPDLDRLYPDIVVGSVYSAPAQIL
ncbi:MAG: hypothetical protein D6730_23090, partial [Bacteroidetes bacterium]